MAHNIGVEKKGLVFGPCQLPNLLKISKGANLTIVWVEV